MYQFPQSGVWYVGWTERVVSLYILCWIQMRSNKVNRMAEVYRFWCGITEEQRWVYEKNCYQMNKRSGCAGTCFGIGWCWLFHTIWTDIVETKFTGYHQWVYNKTTLQNRLMSTQSINFYHNILIILLPKNQWYYI